MVWVDGTAFSSSRGVFGVISAVRSEAGVNVCVIGRITKRFSFKLKRPDCDFIAQLRHAAHFLTSLLKSPKNGQNRGSKPDSKTG